MLQTPSVVVWETQAFALGVLPITLMYIGYLNVIQTAVLVVSLPLRVSGVVMTYSLIRSLPNAENPNH